MRTASQQLYDNAVEYLDLHPHENMKDALYYAMDLDRIWDGFLIEDEYVEFPGSIWMEDPDQELWMFFVDVDGKAMIEKERR